MGKKSIRENKNIYQTSREDLELTRDEASELMGFVSSDRIEKIENERSLPHPDEVLEMSKAYKAPHLCNYYCSHECPIGQKFVPEIKEKDLSRIILEMIATLNSIEEEKNRLIEIAADGEITEDEYEDFYRIKSQLSQISLSIDAMQLWVDKTIAEGRIDKELLESNKNRQHKG